MVLSVALVAFAALVGAPSAGAVILGTDLIAPVTVTGTEGKDELEIEFRSLGQTSSRMIVTPAATITAASGSCPPNTDPLTGRPLFNDCRIGPQGSGTGLIVNLNGGDDSVEVDDDGPFMSQVRVNGGAGNDTIRVREFTERFLRGDDGNDLLVAIGGLNTVGKSGALRPVAFDGGTGVDTVGWEDTEFALSERDAGVTASLATGTATLTGLNESAQTISRTDTLVAVENLTGTNAGDVLNGSIAANMLFGNGGNDNLNGGDGTDTLFGGNDLDNMVSGKGTDSVDGGLGLDLYPADSGGDTFTTRDGYAEDVTCVKSDVIINDLVDKVGNNTSANACSVSTAAAKHLYDTHLSGRPAKIAGRSLATKVSCPALKTEACEGKLDAMLGRKAIAHADYKVQPGQKAAVRLPISEANARKAAGKEIVLSAKEVDADGRDRSVSRPTRVQKA